MAGKKANAKAPKEKARSSVRKAPAKAKPSTKATGAKARASAKATGAKAKNPKSRAPPAKAPETIEALMVKMDECANRGDTDGSQAFFEKIMALREKAKPPLDLSGTPEELIARGNALEDNSEYDRAIRCYEKALELSASDDAMLAKCNYWLGHANFRNYKFNESIPFYEKAATLAEKTGQSALAGLSYLGMSESASGDLRDHDAEEHLRKSAEKFDINDFRNRALVYRQFASIYGSRRSKPDAIRYSEQAVELAMKSGDPALVKEMKMWLDITKKQFARG